MNNKISYLKIYPVDYEILTNIITFAFNEDTYIHTNIKRNEIEYTNRESGYMHKYGLSV